MRTKDKIKELAKDLPAFNKECEIALTKMSRWLLQSAYDKMYKKSKCFETDGDCDYYVKISDIDDILNELNGTPNIPYSDGINQLSYTSGILDGE